MKGKVEMSLESFMDIMEEKADYEQARDELLELLEYIFEVAELGYDNELRLYDSNKIMDYLKIRESFRYGERVEELKMKKEEEE